MGKACARNCSLRVSPTGSPLAKGVPPKGSPGNLQSQWRKPLAHGHVHLSATKKGKWPNYCRDVADVDMDNQRTERNAGLSFTRLHESNPHGPLSRNHYHPFPGRETEARGPRNLPTGTHTQQRATALGPRELARSWSSDPPEDAGLVRFAEQSLRGHCNSCRAQPIRTVPGSRDSPESPPMDPNS